MISSRIFLGLLVCVAACGQPEPKTLRLDFAIRSSCGRSTTTYDMGCMHGLRLRLKNTANDILNDVCVPITGRYASIQDLVSSQDILSVLRLSQTPEVPVVLELQGYHGSDSLPCEAPYNPAQLMFWGQTMPTDLRDSDLEVLTVQMECRPECDCQALDQSPTTCPTARWVAACTPPPAVPCRKSCRSAADCYRGAMACIDGRCQPKAGELCATCSTDADCTDGICVENNRLNERFCTSLCPPENDASPCASSMTCRSFTEVLRHVP